ncbi:hypothetical protein JVX98_12755 [Ensifer sp. PDNC004]|uniref:hypothetical protein n=1 Tax=Ensifer sp. PDNC004 TaxID=2811423 RepID=UPI00196463F8|nr:hypothetical protein [Ensifer sp. PDNC004]QRY69095.1 hypothetical protein JVX98_12755 [Ensifer sp. PDNC004]
MTSLAASLKKQLALALEENERHATSLDTVVAALNETLTALEKHEPEFVAAMRIRFGVAPASPVSGVTGEA